VQFTRSIECDTLIEMDIRRATPDDVPAVLPMVAKICALHESWDAARYGAKPAPQEMYRNWLTARASDPRSVFFVADRSAAEGERRLVGFIVGTVDREIPIYRLAEYGFIHDLWVEEDYRHEGIGRQLAMLAVERFRQIGVKQVRLATAAANDAARGLFAACGFRSSTVEMLVDLSVGT
jgi:ribosomal protein S18 acetylase RimI-like enzyme